MEYSAVARPWTGTSGPTRRSRATAAARRGTSTSASSPQLGNAAWAAGLCLLAAGAEDDAAVWLHCAAERYRESWPDAPPDSWGRPIGAMKSLLLAGDDASAAARWALDAGAADAESPIGRYAGDARAARARRRRAGAGRRADARRPGRLSRATSPPRSRRIAFCDGDAYAAAVLDVLRSFETRTEFLEDVPVADTVLVLQALAEPRGLAAKLPRVAACLP